MTFNCWDCGDEGHLAADCPNRRYMQSIAMMKREPTPPTAEYLEERARLGLPSGEIPLLEVECPWCLRGPWQGCVNPGTGQPKQQAHDARYEAAGLAPPRNGMPQRVAREQLAESRASHPVI